MSSLITRIVLGLLVAGLSFWIGRNSLSGTLQANQADLEQARSSLDARQADLAAAQTQTEEQATRIIQLETAVTQATTAQEMAEQQRAALNTSVAALTNERDAALEQAEQAQTLSQNTQEVIDDLRGQVAALEAAADMGGEADFEFGFNDFPEFSPVLLPDSQEAYLAPHWSDTAYGDPDAPVQIVEFFSYACPHCKRFHEGTYQQLLASHVETGQVYFIKRDFLLNTRSIGLELLAGAGAQCLNNPSHRARFADILFANQRELATSQDPREALQDIMVGLGLSADLALACMRDARNRSLVFGRSIRASQIAEVSGTPTLFINGVPFTGSVDDFDALAAAIASAQP